MSNATHQGARVDWVDHARGLCIALIVMLHSSYSVLGAAAGGKIGYVQQIVEFARPFRLPTLFFISGLFLSRVIKLPWRAFIDARVTRYVYFYLLWGSLAFLFEFGLRTAVHNATVYTPTSVLLGLFVNPHGPHWFIYALPICFAIARAVRDVPVWIVLGVALVLALIAPATGWMVGDRVASRFVFFYAGFVFAGPVFALVDAARKLPKASWMLVGTWALLHMAVTLGTTLMSSTVAALIAGIVAVPVLCIFAGLVADRGSFDILALFGRKSLTIYLTFFVPIVVIRKILLMSPIPIEATTLTLLVALGSLLVCVLFDRLVRHTHFDFLLARPEWAHWPRAVAANGEVAAGAAVAANRSDAAVTNAATVPLAADVKPDLTVIAAAPGAMALALPAAAAPIVAVAQPGVSGATANPPGASASPLDHGTPG